MEYGTDTRGQGIDMYDTDFTCTLTRGTWICQHTCDDPTHGKNGPPRVLDSGHYWRPGDLISSTFKEL
jgi:hypothetical protein